MMFLYFKQKTAYEMRISDWSSDVFSSDLVLLGFALVAALLLVTNVALASTFEDYLLRRTDEELAGLATRPIWGAGGIDPRRPGRGPGEQPLSDTYIGVTAASRERLTRVGYAPHADAGEPAPAPHQPLRPPSDAAPPPPPPV